MGISGWKTQLFLKFKFLFLFARQLKVTILDGCISLKSLQKNLVVLGFVDKCHLLLICEIKFLVKHRDSRYGTVQ